MANNSHLTTLKVNATSVVRRIHSAIALAFVSILIAACSPGIPDHEKTVTRALPEASGSFLSRQSQRLGNPRDGRSGVRMLSNGEDALAVRLLLTAKAERTIDAQYYLLHNDAAGHLFAAGLLRAADRGVRVRLLLDDMDTSEYDDMTAALDLHPNIEIRLINPFWRDTNIIVAGLTDFRRINRRMHNKSMTFDNAFTIVGGRNIGEEYFLAKDSTNYVDLDVMAAGPVVSDVSDVFDEYWNSEYAVPASVVVGQPSNLTLPQARSKLLALQAEAKASPFGDALVKSARRTFVDESFSLQWVNAQVYADPVGKIGGNTDDDPVLLQQLMPYFDNATEEIHIISAYFVPMKAGVDWMADMEDRGVDVEVVTNSNGSNDVAPVYAHYAKARKPLLRSGVELYELRTDLFEREGLGINWFQSRSGLHTKAFTVDDRHMFIGSFNLDPRSVNINTEMGIMLDSAEITQNVIGVLEDKLPENTYELRLTEDDRIIWLTREKDGTINRYRSEPTATMLQQMWAGFLAILPIGPLL